jgi:hypothetical protein
MCTPSRAQSGPIRWPLHVCSGGLGTSHKVSRGAPRWHAQRGPLNSSPPGVNTGNARTTVRSALIRLTMNVLFMPQRLAATVDEIRVAVVVPERARGRSTLWLPFDRRRRHESESPTPTPLPYCVVLKTSEGGCARIPISAVAPIGYPDFGYIRFAGLHGKRLGKND